MAKYFAFYHTHTIRSLNKSYALLFSKASRESKKFVAGTRSPNFNLSVFRRSPRGQGSLPTKRDGMEIQWRTRYSKACFRFPLLLSAILPSFLG